jgi:hypothetical protein
MEARVKVIENILDAVKTDLAVIKSNYATKIDISETRTGIADVRTTVAEAKNQIIIWVVGAFVVTQVVPALIPLIEKMIARIPFLLFE